MPKAHLEGHASNLFASGSGTDRIHEVRVAGFEYPSLIVLRTENYQFFGSSLFVYTHRLGSRHDIIEGVLYTSYRRLR